MILRMLSGALFLAWLALFASGRRSFATLLLICSICAAAAEVVAVVRSRMTDNR
jgi:hypothetical protein